MAAAGSLKSPSAKFRCPPRLAKNPHSQYTTRSLWPPRGRAKEVSWSDPQAPPGLPASAEDQSSAGKREGDSEKKVRARKRRRERGGAAGCEIFGGCSWQDQSIGCRDGSSQLATTFARSCLRTALCGIERHRNGRWLASDPARSLLVVCRYSSAS